ncbi:MAG: TIGR00730 family Rossman fold protein [Planctomycetes bacterium]|nr:TIGR00730 family Rossman fold protein [Planctomycetota bacterium]
MTAILKRICVYCGSSMGSHPRYRAAAAALGQVLARRRLTLVYGAGNVGTMGVIADAVLAHGGDVVGVIPQVLVDMEVAHTGLGDLRIVDTMHERKAMMAQLADAFIALPGGMGTLEELAEILTWAQLDLHKKPIGLLNVAGYFDHLLRFFDQAVADGFLRAAHRDLVLVDTDADRLLERFLGMMET